MPRIIVIPLLLASCSLLVAKSYVAESFDVRVRVNPDAALAVRESIRFSFHGGEFTYVNREIPKRGLDRITDVEAWIDGAPANISITESTRALRVRWRFHTGAETTRVFTLSYRVEGAIREEPGCAFLLWRTIPEDHDYRVLAGEITVEYPQAETLSPPEVAAAAAVRHEPDHALFTLPELPPDRGAPIRLAFRSSFLARPPDWQVAEREASGRTRAPWITAIAAVFLAGILGGWWLTQARSSFSPNPTPAPGGHESQPSEDFPPAFATRLSTAGTTAHAAMATLFDLARRGVVSIRGEEPGRFGRRKYRIVPVDTARPLLRFEKAVLDLALRSGDPDGDFARFASRLATHAGNFNGILERQLIDRGLFDAERLRARRSWLTWGTVAALTAVAVAAVLAKGAVASGLPLAARLFAAFAGVAAGGLFVSIGALVVGAKVSPLTRAGAAAAEAFHDLRRTLAAQIRGESPVDPINFERLLPVAVALGLGSRWVKRFQAESAIPMPEWFAGGDGLSHLALYDFVSYSAASADASASAGADGGSGGGSSSAG